MVHDKDLQTQGIQRSIAAFVNTVDLDETAHIKSHVCLLVFEFYNTV